MAVFTPVFLPPPPSDDEEPLAQPVVPEARSRRPRRGRDPELEKQGYGRTLLNPELADRIVALFREGHYVTTVARAVRIAPKTLEDWLRRGEQDHENAADTPFHRLYLEAHAAESSVEMDVTHTFVSAAKQDWVAGRAFLERRYPERWRKRDEARVTGSGGGPIQVLISPEVDDAI